MGTDGRLMKPKEYGYSCEGEGVTAFVETNEGITLSRVFGMPCGSFEAGAAPPQAQGLFTLNTDKGRFGSGNTVRPVNAGFGTERADIAWEAPGAGLTIESAWVFHRGTGIWSRRDGITNSSLEAVTVTSFLTRFAFLPGKYEVYSQSGRWCGESQGCWQTVRHGGMALYCEAGRTTQGSTPYLCLREEGGASGIIFHIVPQGNWVIKIKTQTAPEDSLPFVLVELGLADDNLRLEIKPGESIRFPEILMQELPNGDPRRGAPGIQRYILDRFIQARGNNESPPIVYNTWFDAFDCLDAERLGRQLYAAKKLGCEIFVVDAGWYGAQGNGWFMQAGDWREKQDGAFFGRMLEFADEVRSYGMGFGLWMEMERVCPGTPVLSEHPEWFLSADNGFYYPDIVKNDAYCYLLGEVSRLIETYKLAWLKLDFNFGLGVDPYGSEFLYYYRALYKLLGELKEKYPNTFIEGCSSGGMRLEINALLHFDGCFLSDDAHPADMLRISQGTVLRLPAGLITKWIVLRSLGNSIPRYGMPLAEAPEKLVSPAGATWEFLAAAGIDFAAAVALAGIPGIGGDIGGISGETLEKLRGYVAFYKEWRSFISRSQSYLLSPVESKENHCGWAAIQLQGLDSSKSLLFAYRLNDASSGRYFRLCGLDDNSSYSIADFRSMHNQPNRFSGRQLMSEGLPVTLLERFSATIYIVSPVQ
jgi:alpha-galactosidase